MEEGEKAEKAAEGEDGAEGAGGGVGRTKEALEALRHRLLAAEKQRGKKNDSGGTRSPRKPPSTKKWSRKRRRLVRISDSDSEDIEPSDSSAGTPSSSEEKAKDLDGLEHKSSASEAAAEESFFTGTVKWFSRKQGFGFITADGGRPQAEVFLHASDCLTEPGFAGARAGTRVRFQVQPDGHSIRAVRVEAETGGPIPGHPPQPPPFLLPSHTTAQLPPGRFRGHVSSYNPDKGFGFITPEDPDVADIFVHASDLHGASLLPQERVEYSVVRDSSGRPRAVSVTGPGGAGLVGLEHSRPRVLFDPESGQPLLAFPLYPR